MHQTRWRTLAIAVGFVCTIRPVWGQTDQFLPEVGLYSGVRDGIRLRFQAKQTREANEPVQAEIGPSIDFYVHPVHHLVHIARFDLDDTKDRLMVLSAGYRYLPEANGGAATNRIVPALTIRFPFTSKLSMADRNRFDLDWKNHGFTWRYRNRFQVEGPVRVASYHLTPYVSAEAFYQSQYGKFSDTAIYAGCLLPIGRHVQLDPYYEHQNESGKRPNNQLDQVGIILNLYF